METRGAEVLRQGLILLRKKVEEDKMNCNVVFVDVLAYTHTHLH